jgi:hypothetical protein
VRKRVMGRSPALRSDAGPGDLPITRAARRGPYPVRGFGPKPAIDTPFDKPPAA